MSSIESHPSLPFKDRPYDHIYLETPLFMGLDNLVREYTEITEPLVLTRNDFASRVNGVVKPLFDFLSANPDQEVYKNIYDQLDRLWQVVDGRGCSEIEVGLLQVLEHCEQRLGITSGEVFKKRTKNNWRLNKDTKEHGHLLPEIDRVIIFPSKKNVHSYDTQCTLPGTEEVLKIYKDKFGISIDLLRGQSVVEFGGAISLIPERMAEQGVRWICVDPASRSIGLWEKLANAEANRNESLDDDAENDMRRRNSKIWPDEALYGSPDILKADARGYTFATIYSPVRSKYAELALKINPNLHLDASAAETGLDSESQDLVVASKFFHSLYDQYILEAANDEAFIDVVKEIYRILKPKGKFVFYPLLSHFMVEEKFNHLKDYNQLDLEEIMSKINKIPDPDYCHLKNIKSIDEFKKKISTSQTLSKEQLLDPKSLLLYFKSISSITEEITRKKPQLNKVSHRTF